jgi:hypothetical protein
VKTRESDRVASKSENENDARRSNEHGSRSDRVDRDESSQASQDLKSKGLQLISGETDSDKTEDKMCRGEILLGNFETRRERQTREGDHEPANEAEKCVDSGCKGDKVAPCSFCGLGYFMSDSSADATAQESG